MSQFKILCLFSLAFLPYCLNATVKVVTTESILSEQAEPQLFGQIPPESFNEKDFESALELLEIKKQKISSYFTALKMLYELKTEQISGLIKDTESLLLGNTDSNENLAYELEALYENPEEEKIIKFIKDNKLSDKNIFLVLFPLLRDQLLAEEQIFHIIEETKFSLNTQLQVKDIVLLLLSLDSSDFDNSYIDPEMILTSFGQVITSSHNTELITKLYSMEGFNPNLTNEMEQTPLQSLFMEKELLKDLHQRELPEVNWEMILSAIQNHPEVDFNFKDIEGRTALALASANGYLEAVQLLVEIPSVDLYALDNYGRTVVIMASLSNVDNKKEITRWLIKKGGSQLVVPSIFNEYLTEKLDPVRIETLHPLQEIIWQSFSILDQKKEEGFNAYSDSLVKLHEQERRFEESRQIRSSLIEVMGTSITPYYDIPVIKAIRNDNAGFFEKNYNKDVQGFAETVFLSSSLVNTRKDHLGNLESGEPFSIGGYNLLLYAIAVNAPEVVEFFLEHLKNPDIFQPSEVADENPQNTKDFAYMDPLSEALLLSAQTFSEKYVKNKELEQKKNSKIVQLLMEHPKVNLAFKDNFMNISPMEIAILTGQLHVVKQLDDKEVDFPEDSLWDTGVKHIEVSDRLGFKGMVDYLKQADLHSAGVECKMLFH